MDNVDPTQFLAQGNEEEEEEEIDNDKQPPILASLGLTHISQVSLFINLLFQSNFPL